MEMKATIMIVLGVVSLLICVLYWLFIANTGSQVAARCDKCGGGNQVDDFECRYCSTPLKAVLPTRQAQRLGRMTGELDRGEPGPSSAGLSG